MPANKRKNYERTSEAPPTSVVTGPGGAYYLSELTGAPFVYGKANIYRVVPWEAPRLFLTSDAFLSHYHDGWWGLGTRTTNLLGSLSF